ncbi:site-specific integrase [Tetragenococcus halophilus]|uniref:Site-specific recombinase n=1 Tax=Tetragenococcus halophilus (strain DSM 20338 / JCM 20259 / NCIMB 9735 / NBRC 12172) TaxID=945021 RepID=A0AAN1SG23_TETHN|nr:site-specific integrase [Tetragenococcus halophilus]MCO7027055.1 site-specific integrase [Tetragenococcus halophilus]NRR75036.1 site-specific integrase [Tetragenococcus halophilus]NWO00896.1 site-specific integrase [Tetragenococcus halophilus]QXN86258.1 site-specific integrase [Tetragenococcus halophilus]RQD29201.1 site-specific integrase [Tetragenococcus halophilus subsp. halophilus DSM 20339]
MAIEKIKHKNIKATYRSKVYFKGKRYLGVHRKTKKEAELDEINQKKEFLTGEYSKETNKTLDDGFDDYITLIAPKNLSIKALKIAKSNYKNHIQPELGHRLLNELRPLEIQKFLNKKELNLTGGTVIKFYTLLNQIYKMMLSWNELKANPLQGVSKPKIEYKPKMTLTKDQCHQFLLFAKNYQSYMAFWLALQFGLRLGEALGLQWEDVDLKNNVLYIRQAYHEETKELGRLKTKASERSIPLSQQQSEFLKDYKQNQFPQSTLVASNEKGGFLMKSNIKRARIQICKRAEVPNVTFHELRHTQATLMLEMNEHPKIVQQRLGHVKVETTLDIYSHVRPQVHQKSAQRFSDFFEK